ncbi:MAG: FmdB family zinc ribbon protein, partial [Candidatus Acidiferrales bacterium]
MRLAHGLRNASLTHAFSRGASLPRTRLARPCYYFVYLRFEGSLELPLYEYKCIKCGHRIEKIEKVTARTTQKCLKCGGKAERMFAAPAIQFKG